jgi:hypothetical protein
LIFLYLIHPSLNFLFDFYFDLNSLGLRKFGLYVMLENGAIDL